MAGVQPKRALVTGASGFIGSRLTRQLIGSGVAVAVVARPTSVLDQLGDAADRVTLLRHDGSTAQLCAFVEEFAPEAVFHLAATFVGRHGPEDVAPLVADNVGFTAQLCEAMAAAGSRCLVAAGTAWQHAPSPPGDRAPTPNSLYAATKQAAEDIIAYYARADALSSIVLKIYDSYGPGDPRPKFLNALAAAAAAGCRLKATTGEQLMHLVHVDDIVAAFRHAADLLLSGDADGCQSYALASAEPQTLRAIAALWQEASGRRVDIAWGARARRPGEVMVPWQGPPLPGWKPKISLKSGLRGLSGT